MKKRKWLIIIVAIEALLLGFTVILVYRFQSWNPYAAVFYVIPFELLTNPNYPLTSPKQITFLGAAFLIVLFCLNSLKWMLFKNLFIKRRWIILGLVSVLAVLSLIFISGINDYGS